MQFNYNFIGGVTRRKRKASDKKGKDKEKGGGEKCEWITQGYVLLNYE